jgi:hypothetical protein
MTDDVYDPPRRSAELYERYVGKKPGPFQYLVSGTRTKYTIDRDVTACDTGCFCRSNPAAACQNGLDCSAWGWRCPQPASGPTSGLTGPVPGQILPPEPLSSWMPCSAEGGTCTFRGKRRVRFGAGGFYAIHTVTGSTPCTVAAFGDPASGVPKSCDVEVPGMQIAPPVSVN